MNVTCMYVCKDVLPSPDVQEHDDGDDDDDDDKMYRV